VIWRPFELRPEGTPPPDRSYIERSFNNYVRPLAQELGVVMHPPAASPKTRLAHEAALYAREQGRGQEMAHALFRAHWEHGRDIGQVEVICDAGLNAGIDPVELRDVLDRRAMQEACRLELQTAFDFGINVVPFFRFDRKVGARGLQTEDELRRLIDRCKQS